MGIKNLGKFLTTKYAECIEPFFLKPEHKLAIDLTLFIHRFYYTDSLKSAKSIADRIVAFDKRLVCVEKVYVVDGGDKLVAKKHAHERRQAARDTHLEKSTALETRLKMLEDELSTFKDTEDIVDEEEFLYKKMLIDAKLHLESQMEVEDVRGVGVDRRMMEEIIGLLSAKLKVVQSDCGEAEKYCAKLAREKLVDFVVTEDLDTLCFGSPNLVRGITTDSPKVIYLENLLACMSLTYDEFVDFCILSGSDFTISPKGFGPATAMKEFLKSEKMLDKVNYLAKKWTVEERDEFLCQCEIARAIFKNSTPSLSLSSSSSSE